MGYSFGGYHAPRIVAFEKRYAAAVAFGAMHWSIYEWVAGNKARLAVDPRTSSTSIFQFRWVVGAPDNATALEWAKKFTLEGVAQRIACAFLVLHGENDRIVPLAEAKKLYEAVGSKRKHIKIFTADEGGAEHCQVNHRQPWRRLYRRLAARKYVKRRFFRFWSWRQRARRHAIHRAPRLFHDAKITPSCVRNRVFE
jgi:dipeptidyl aminopeptidase/acylaminoacyl peptidase